MEQISTSCVIAGGGLVGLMLGYLQARAGVDVTVLEKHKDFLRDFRGDTVHPSTLEVMHELGMLDEFLKLPHQRLKSGGALVGDSEFTISDFSRVPTHCIFVALMPQWDFLNFLAEQGARYRTFDLRLEHEAVGVIEQDGRVTGVEVKTPGSETTTRVLADLVIACDGRHSILR